MQSSTFLPTLLKLEIGLLTAGIFFGMVSPALLLSTCILGGGLLLLRILSRRFTRTPVDIPAVILFAASILSLMISAVPEITAAQVYRLWSGMLLFYAIVHAFDTEEKLKRVPQLLWLAGVGLFLFSLISVEWNTEKLPFLPAEIYDRFFLLVSDTVNPNVLAGSLLIFAVFFFQNLIWTSPRKSPIYWLSFGAALILVSAMLVLSQSRSALLALVMAGALLIALRWRWGWTVVGLGALAAAWGASQYGITDLADVFFGGQQFKGFDGRAEIWARGIFMLQDFPFTGIGMGLFWDVVSRIYPLSPDSTAIIYHVHNLFLQIGIDLGLPGLIAWTAISLSGFYILVRLTAALGDQRHSWRAGFAAALLAVLCAVYIHGIFDSVIWGMVRTAPLLWLVWGCVFALWRVYNSGKEVAG